MTSISNVSELGLPGVKLIEVCETRDNRGRNLKLFSSDDLETVGIHFSLREILLIHSNKNVLRGMHYQRVYEQSRMISCLQGKLFVAVAEMSPNSEKCIERGRNCTCVLREPHQYIYIPAGYVVGTYALEDTDFLYMCGEHPFVKDYTAGIRWDDSVINIIWPVIEKNIIISAADQQLPDYETAMTMQGEA